MIIQNRTPTRSQHAGLLVKQLILQMMGKPETIVLVTNKTLLKARHRQIKGLSTQALIQYLVSKAEMQSDCGVMTCLPEGKNPSRRICLYPTFVTQKTIKAPLWILSKQLVAVLMRDLSLVDILFPPNLNTLEDFTLTRGVLQLGLKVYTCEDVTNTVPSNSVQPSPQRAADIKFVHQWLQQNESINSETASRRLNKYYTADSFMASVLGWVPRPGTRGYFSVA